MNATHAIREPLAVDAMSGVEVSTPAPSVVPEPASLVPPPAGGLGDDAMTAIAILLTQADDNDRDTSRKIEDAADNAAVIDANARVNQMLDKANQDRDGALCSGLLGIAGGAFTIASGFVPDGKCLATGAQVSTNWTALADGASKITPSLGSIVAGAYKATADRDDADAAKVEASEQLDIRRYNEAHEDVQAAEASIQKVEQFLQGVLESENAARLTAASGLRG
jgi:hypothetical protein